jgi:hypothetical protein
MIKHTGSARDPLPAGGYSNGESGGVSVARWIILAVAVVAIGATIVGAGKSFLPSDVTARVAGAFSPKG